MIFLYVKEEGHLIEVAEVFISKSDPTVLKGATLTGTTGTIKKFDTHERAKEVLDNIYAAVLAGTKAFVIE